MQDTTGADLREIVAQLLDEPVDAIDDETDLITLGLNSIAMMRLAGQWRRSGHDVAFADLVAAPTLAAWRALLGGPAGAPTVDELPMEGSGEEDAGEPFELAGMQHAYWVGRDPSQPLGGVGAHFYHEFDGPDVDPDRLGRAVAALFARHDMLRARFDADGRQRIAPDPAWTALTVHDDRGLSPAAAQDAVLARRDRLSHRRLDVGNGEVFDVGLTRMPGGRTRLHVNLDMLVADAVSFRTLLAELAQLYERPDEALPPIDYSYRRYLAQRAEPNPRHREFWAERVPGLPGAPELPVVAGPVGEHRILRRHHRLDGDALAALGRHARARAVTPAMALTTCFGEVIAAWSTQPRFLLNVPMFGREPLHPHVDRLVGDFTGSVLLEFDASAPATFAERAAATQDRFRTDAAHAAFTGVDVLRELSRDRGRQVIAPVVLTSALNLGELYTDAFRRCFGSPCWIVSQGPQVWLDAQLTELDGGLLVNWDALDRAFPPGMLDAMFAAFTGLVESLARGEGWDAGVGSLLPDVAARVRAQVNDTGAGVDGLLHEAFFARAATEPERVAVLGAGAALTYGEVAASALRIAGALAAAGVVPGDAVAVGLPKGPAQVTAVLGVLAAGAAYVPVGVDQPPARRARIAATAGVRAVLSAPGDGQGWPDGVAPVDPDAPAGPLPAPVPAGPEDPAYLLFTSGSTGEPKGVVVPHRAAFNTVDDLVTRFGLGAGDRTLALSALDFDLSVFDLFAPLLAGGAVVVPDESGRRDAGTWRELCAEHDVTVLNCVPALLDMLLAAGAPAPDAVDPQLAALRLVLLGGDRVGVDLPARLAARAPAARFVALGGTTETAIHSTVCDLGTAGVVPGHWRSVPYGTPLRGVALRVVDALGRDCPDHVTGELWIGGAGVADGYRGDPERTAASFLRVDGRRWYRTGDLARYVPDGTVEFLGRADAQVKVRGHRIELGEIEAALEAHPGVRTAVAAVVPGPAARLAAAVVAEPGAVVATDDLIGRLSEQLPAYMVPASLTVLDDVPLTANGKVHRRRVRDGLARAPRTDAAPGTPPRGPVETTVADAWAELLRVPQVHREDGFFALGGDSLVATRLLARLRAEGLTGASIGALFARPVLSEFAAGLRSGDPTAAPAAFVPAPEHRYEPFGPTDVQRAYWMGRTDAFALGGIGCHFYREYEPPLGTGIDADALGRAVDVLVARHGALRTVFDARGDQRVLPDPGPYRVPVVEGPDAFDRLRTGYDHRVFDPSRWPLFTVALAREGGRTRIAIGIDNLVADALSVLTFHAELGTLLADPTAVLPPPGPTFRDYLRHAVPDPAEVAAARADWTSRLPDLPPPPQLPLRVDPSQVGPPRFTRRAAHLGAASWDAVTARAREHGLTPSAVLLAAFGEVLGTWSARRDLTVNVTLFDRADVAPGVPGVIGDFTSLMLVSHRPGAHWLDTARRVQGDLSRGLDHRAVSAVWVQRELGRLTGDPEFTVPVVFTSALGLGAGGPGTSALGEQVYGISQTPQVWLDHQVTDAADGGVDLNWDAVEELFPAGVLDAMFDGYRRLLEHLARTDWTGPVPDLRPAAQLAVRERVNDTAWPSPETVLHHGFFDHARHRPDRTALLHSGGSLTYGGLADRALRIAALLRERGVRDGDLVTVVLPKGPDQIAALLGVLAAGAGYVPVGVDQPPARRARIQALAGSVLTVADHSREDGSAHVGVREADGVDPLPAPVGTDPDRTAYVIFTSGSTGEPKGVELTHRAAANTVADVAQRGGLGPADRVLAVSGYDFDLSVFDVFGLLGAGGALVLVDEDERRDARRWLQLVDEHRVTVWNSVPPLLDMLLVVAQGGGATLPGLRLALLSGDWVAPDLPERTAAVAPAVRFLALGGATEAAIWSNAIELTHVEPGWRSAPYGFPLRGQCFRVVDDARRDRPDWVPGELWIGGDGLAVGYRGAPETTARSFVSDRGARWYRTGDRGRYRPDGCLEFLGRTDEQIKLRGHRIELGEIESALAAAPGVGQAVAVVDGDGPARRLLAAVVPAAPRATTGTVDTPAPGPAHGFDDGAAAALEREALVAESALGAVLDLPRTGEGAVDLAVRSGATERSLPVLRLWLDWLVRRDVLVAVPGGHVAGPRIGAAASPPDERDDLAGRAGRRLRERADDYRAFLDGRADPVALLDDPVLAPERLADAEPGAGPALDAVAAAIAERAARTGEPVDVVELDGRSGSTAVRILDRLAPGQVRYTLLEESATLRSAATRRTEATRHRVTVRPADPVPVTDLLHRFDVVVAHNVAHRRTDPSQGPAVAALLARPGGELHLVERVLLSPLALLTATLLDGGYDGLDPARRAAGSPMVGGPRWAALVRDAGFPDAVDHPVPGAPLTVVRGTRPVDVLDPDPDALRRNLLSVLPAPMVPDRVAVLPWLPLTGNGKLDRGVVARLAAADPEPDSADAVLPPSAPEAEPVGETEQFVAETWAELLERPRVGRAESFFALGGDSLLATRFLESARVRFGVTLPLRRLFAAPTVAEVAASLTAGSGSDDVEEGAL